MIAKFLCALAALCAFASVPAHAVTFETVFPDAAAFSSEERERIRTHVELAGQAWVEVLHVSAPEAVITVEVLLASIPTATGRSLWVGHLGQLGSSQLWEQGMAFELRTGVDDNGADSDVEFVLGASYLRDTLWLPEDPMAGNVPADRVDAFSVFLHEFGHALAYNGWADGDGALMPGHASAWDQWLLPTAGSGTLPLFLGPQAGSSWGSAPDVTWNNPSHLGNAADSGPARAWAGAVEARTSVVQWDPRSGAPVPLPACRGLHALAAPRTAAGTALPVSGLLAQLMNGVAFYRGHRYGISALDRAVLRDLGLDTVEWQVHADGFETPAGAASRLR